MSRTYSDPSYGSEKRITIPGGAIALNGTVTSTTEKARSTMTESITVTDMNVEVLIGGTAVDTKVVLGKSAAGTGTIVPFGTVTLTGTKTANSVIDATVTATNLDAGDDIVYARLAGTETETAIRAQGVVQYKERFVQSDN